jgi:GDP-mannose 6-dehydrogenase
VNISIFGLGYVGVVTAACLTRAGHRVVGIDTNAAKVGLIGDGSAPIVEPGVGELLLEARRRGLLHATSDAAEAVRESELSIVCVGTPSRTNGSLDTDYLERVCEDIGSALRNSDDFHVVAVRSTVLPGTLHSLVIPTLEKASGRRAGENLGVCFNPEFMREGTAVYDFENPPKTVIGSTDEKSAAIVASLYEDLDAPLLHVDVQVSEMVKYADNCWHAIKIGFANEIGTIAKAIGIDGHDVMDVFCRDEKLNISTAYLKPGQAFGGSCLPKDLRALTYHARSLDIETPLLSSALATNKLHAERALELVLQAKSRKVGVLGFSFKAGTDDLRESPVLDMIETLLGKGYDLRIFDRNVNLAKLVGANKEFLLTRIPHVSALMVESIDEVVDHADTIVIGNKDPDFARVLDEMRPGQTVIDLVRIAKGRCSDDGYQGICW